jgi:hypothetical protein
MRPEHRQLDLARLLWRRRWRRVLVFHVQVRVTVDLLTLNTTASKNELTRYIINWRIFVYILSAY